MSDATLRLLSGATWNEFCETLKTAGNVVLSRTAPADELTRAEVASPVRPELNGAVHGIPAVAELDHRLRLDCVHLRLGIGAQKVFVFCNELN